MIHALQRKRDAPAGPGDRRDTLRIALVVTGFPSESDSATGIFNLRAACALSRSVDLNVVHLRSWRPRRPFLHVRSLEGMHVWTLAIPHLPALLKPSLEMYKRLSWSAIAPLLSGCDVIHSVGLSFAGIVGAHWSRLASVCHVTQITSEVELEGPRLSPQTLRFIHGVACNSDALAAQYRARYPSARNVRAVYRGVDLDRFTVNAYAKRPRAASAGVRFLFLGGFPAYRDLRFGRNTKGGETLLEAWRVAEAELANASAQLVIGGPSSTDDAMQRWRAGLHYPERVQLIGNVEPDAVAGYMQSCDAVLVPSLQEGFPNVALEAAACGRAVLASALDGIAELVVNGETGVLLRPGDSQTWAAALVRFAKAREHLEVLGESARARAESSFDANAYPEHMLDLYRSALREPIAERSSIDG